MASNWTDERKEQAKQAYLAAEPTPENSMEIVQEIATEMGESANGVRMILTKMKNEDGSGVYITKTPAKKATTTAASGDKAPRVSKEGAQSALSEAITAAGGTPDAEIISKLTGKAAQYFAGVIAAISSND